MSSSEQATGASLPPSALLRALRHLLRPLVRVLLSNQITYPLLSNELKSVYLEMAEREFALEGKRQTASRLSLMTGLHRKDIKRLRELPAPEYAPPPSVSLGARLVARWVGSARFQDPEGRPLALMRSGGEGEPCFEELVASVSTDIRPRAVLDEWLRLGVAEIDEQDRVCLCVDAFVPKKGFDEKAHYLGRNLHDHIGAAAHNLAGHGQPFLERSVHYEGLAAESVEELRELAERVGMEALRTLNRRALALRKRDARKGARPLRMNFGVYFFQEEQNGPAQPREADDD